MTDNHSTLAELMFPHIQKKPEEYELLYPLRNLPAGARVTRYAPSPTGFVHIGALYAAMIALKLAHQTEGVFYLRVEDTDKKREVEDGITEIVTALQEFGIDFDEGMLGPELEKGSYGPYLQSKRWEIYQTFAKFLVTQGSAYPCFCSEAELDEKRKKQEEAKIATGYFGEWATCRKLSTDEAIRQIEHGQKWVLRLKSQGNPERKLIHTDLIKGRIEFPENHQDIIIIKSDGLPTYHFAHLIDDHLMRTTHVVRGDEWLISTPVHRQLFAVMGWEPPYYAHIAPIVKEDGSSRRKLSKRKDPEAAVMFYHEQGYPNQAVKEYLMTLANSNFEDWRRENPQKEISEFTLEFKKMSTSGALFDLNKLTDISRGVIATMTAAAVYQSAAVWANTYDPELSELFKDATYAKQILNIDRETAKPRKDIAKWSEVKGYIAYFYDRLFDCTTIPWEEFPGNISKEKIREILEAYLNIYSSNDDKVLWFEKVKSLSENLGYARDTKTYKQSPAAFHGHVGDVSMVIRVAVTGRKNTPDLYEVMQVLGAERVMKRLKK